VRKRQESEPALISSERSVIPLVEKRERRENCQSFMIDEERLNSRGCAVIYRPNRPIVSQ